MPVPVLWINTKDDVLEGRILYRHYVVEGKKGKRRSYTRETKKYEGHTYTDLVPNRNLGARQLVTELNGKGSQVIGQDFSTFKLLIGQGQHSKPKAEVWLLGAVPVTKFEVVEWDDKFTAIKFTSPLSSLALLPTEIQLYMDKHLRTENHQRERLERNPYLGVQQVRWEIPDRHLYNLPNYVTASVHKLGRKTIKVDGNDFDMQLTSIYACLHIDTLI